MNSMISVPIPGTTLQVADVGQGPVILFAHGFPLDHSMWDGVIAELSRDFRCLAPDLRGFGASTVTEGTVGMEQFADDLAALLDALRINEPIVFCGLSMGGYVAWQFARRHARRLRALVLCDTRAAPDTLDAAANRLKLADDVVRQGPALVADSMLPRLFAPDTIRSRPELVEQTRRVILTTNSHGIAAAARGMAIRPDARPWLTSINTPSLLLVGEHDTISPPAEMREIATSLPNARLELIAGSGHMAPAENSHYAGERIGEFLEKVRNSVFAGQV